MAQILLQTVWLIPCYPLIGGVLSMLWFPALTRRTGPRPSGYVNAILTLIAFLHGVIALTAIWNQPAQQQFIPWLNVAGLDLTIPVEISSVTVGATVLITGLNLLAQIYAFGYMEMDWGWARFFSLMGLFEAGMCGLVLCNSLFFSYMILEVLTLGTYLLVGLWFNQSLVVTGARDAFLTKRVGDLFLLMGVVAILPLAGTWNFDELAVWAQTAHLDPTVATLLALALIAGPMGKCAQFPLHLWLDEAMEGPLPATILRNTVVVETGAWILIKLQPVIALSPIGLKATIIVGAATAVGASLIAIAQIDIKRTLSYIVSSYMGLVFIAVGTGQTETALTLIFAYSLAMGLLVMSIGSVVWNSITQDVRSLGGLWRKRPISAISFIVGSAGLVGLPPFGCFWALEELASGLSETHPLLLGIVLFVNGVTAFGLVRVFGLVFGGKPKQMTERSPEVHWPFILPMTVLMGFTLHVPHLLAAWQLLPVASLNYTATGLVVLSSAIGIGTGALVYLNEKWEKPVRIGSEALQDFFAYDFYTAKLYRVTVIFAVGLVAQIISWIDRNLVDGFVNLIGLATVFGGQSLKYNVNGQTQFYALTILFGVALLGLIVSWPLLARLSLIVGG
ncbi:MAG: NAD(P)H-quinone oxidoreductase subunit F [Oscillatoriales cyanobacterium]|uniref:NAD(P)H-quinone oxidoreductase subunit F n=1 Tax=Microcoleus anatoxicus PTRS2 TaxID=2705321 RepID=A0ABU8YSQ7_9CYAN|nr:MAG: NAD(P)H-quinone oxidoreductase subunit F [Oscillatoriales cyanobacterium]TAD93171.1 MAG: NAD(P)H-quinone oxidoreductase subunit F [Oscillatoriales cyanobacterium]TAE03086.1 MAG: NAD(P)H-quinone oxidoreductase subunit F [Oscillatoriales cyanobacterium]TAF00049.1 MAG: NAD(P)H-quinone oxidoreductase subunit F [Oscillatoriales cyanobacterium]TAF43437.1 MAG: NAD(P)H-quinone oxidoreductase subunit F [Oscillatoriales cyanobacterium]